MTQTAREPVVVVFGDSITQALEVPSALQWPTLLEERLRRDGRPCRVVNAGVGGNTTGLGLDRMQADVLEHSPYLVTVEFGLNDCHWAEVAGPRTGEAQFRKQQERIGRRVLEETDAKLVYITNQPTLLHALQPDGRPYDDSNRAYNEITREVAAGLGAPVIDIERAWDGGDTPLAELLSFDGIHLSARGNGEYSQVIGDVLTAHVPPA